MSSSSRGVYLTHPALGSLHQCITAKDALKLILQRPEHDAIVEAWFCGRLPSAVLCRADVVLVGSEVDIVEEVRKATGDIPISLPPTQWLLREGREILPILG